MKNQTIGAAADPPAQQMLLNRVLEAADSGRKACVWCAHWCPPFFAVLAVWGKKLLDITVRGAVTRVSYWITYARRYRAGVGERARRGGASVFGRFGGRLN